MRRRTKAGLFGIALVTAVGVLVAPNATSATGTKSYAYGIALGGQGKQPYAEYPAGPPSGGGDVPPQMGPLASGGVLTVTAGNKQATAKITNLTLGSAVDKLPDSLKQGVSQISAACVLFEKATGLDTAVQALNDAIDQTPLGPIINLPTAEAAGAFCKALTDAKVLELAKVGTLLTQCHGHTGSVVLTDVSVLGAEDPALAGPVKPNTDLLPAQLAPVARIILNRQTTPGDGSITVDGLVVQAGGQDVAVLASATCGVPIKAPRKAHTPKPPQAPQPKPVERNVPVTG